MATKKIWTYCFHVARLLAAVILLQTLYFKFGALPESVEIFTMLGVEPWGRIGSGLVELLAGLLLLWPATAWYGAIIAVVVMLGAIVAHVAILGINSLFFMAIITLFAAFTTIILIQKKLHVVKK